MAFMVTSGKATLEPAGLPPAGSDGRTADPAPVGVIGQGRRVRTF
jgi:hypothetical protein